MKTSETIIESLADMKEVATGGDLRRIVSNSLLALVRKEISAADITALAKGVEAISHSLDAEVNVQKMRIQLMQMGGDLGRVSPLGTMYLGNPVAKDQGQQ